MKTAKSAVKAKRDWLQQLIYVVINPFVRLLIRMGFTPNTVTTIGFLCNVAAAAVFCAAGYEASIDGTPHYGLITWGGALIIIFSLFDMLDGQVARLGNMATTFGAMYDSVLDRYCEMLTLGGISYYMIMTCHPIGALITFIALVGSLMVSYVRARAEGLGIECKIGFMQRPERVVVTAVSALACGITGQSLAPDSSFDAVCILTVAMGIIAVFANLTAFARLGHSKREMQKKEKK